MEITWPNVAGLLTDSLVDLQRSQEIVESPYSYEGDVIDYGGARWRGQTTIAPIGIAGPAMATSMDELLGHEVGYRIEAFLQLLSDVSNWAEVPINREPGALPSANLSFTNAAIVRGNMLQVVAGSSVGELKSGQFVRIGKRTHRVVDISGSNINMIPAIAPDTSSMTGIDTIRAKIVPGTSPAGVTRTPSFMGPWVVSWQEFLGD